MTARRFGEWVIRFRWWILILMPLIVLASASGGRFLTFSDDYRLFFSKENPDLLAFEALQNTYSKSDNVLFVIAPKDGKVFTRETLASVAWLTKEAWQAPYSRRVDSVTNFQHTSASADGDDIVVRSLVGDPASMSEADIDRAREIALTEPLLIRRLISPQAHVTGVNVTFVLPQKDLTEGPDVVAFVRKLAEKVREQNPNVEVYLTGVVMLNQAFSESAQKDMKTLVPLMYGAMILVTFLALRSISGTVATVMVILFSILTAMGLAGGLGFQLTPVSISAPTIILTLAVADSIHLLLSIFHAMGSGQNKREAIIHALDLNFYPLFLTTLNTVIGFLTLNFSDVPPYRDLGNIVAIGVITAFCVSVLFLPALMAVLPVRSRPPHTWGDGVMATFANFIIKYRRPILPGMTLLAVGLMLFIPRNEFNDQFVQYFDESVEFRRDNDFATAQLTGVYQIDYSLGSGENEGISRPDYLNRIEAFAEWYRKQSGVIHVNVLTDVIKQLNKNMHGDAPNQYRIPDARNLIAQYLLLHELSPPFGLDLNDQIDVNRSATRMTVTLKNLPSKEIIGLNLRAQRWLVEHAPLAMQARGTGAVMMFSHIGMRNTKSMIWGDILGVVLISGVMIVALRSVKFGLITLIPNILPLGMAIGLWGLFVGRLGMDVAPVTGMTFGILVDDTIHNISKYIYARRQMGSSPEDAIRYTFSTVGMATCFSSLILIVGFSMLTFSAFQFNVSMGLLTAITIAMALFAEFFMLPPLLLKMKA